MYTHCHVLSFPNDYPSDIPEQNSVLLMVSNHAIARKSSVPASVEVKLNYQFWEGICLVTAGFGI